METLLSYNPERAGSPFKAYVRSPVTLRRCTLEESATFNTKTIAAAKNAAFLRIRWLMKAIRPVYTFIIPCG